MNITDKLEYWKSSYWCDIINEMHQKAWKNLEGRELYQAGFEISGITNKMRIEALGRLDGEWFWWAIRYWPGVISELEKIPGMQAAMKEKLSSDRTWEDLRTRKFTMQVLIRGKTV